MSKNNNEDIISRTIEKRRALCICECCLNLGDYISCIRPIAETTKNAAGELREASEETGVGLDQFGEGVRDGADTELEAEIDVDLAEELRNEATDTITEGHHYYDCIKGTCLEDVVRYIAENIAVPAYEFIGKTCCKCVFRNGTESGVGDIEGMAGETANITSNMDDCMEGAQVCCRHVSYVLDDCILGEAMAFALPLFGLIISLMRLLQGSFLICRAVLGMCFPGKYEREWYAWMTVEGKARVGQGLFGLLSGAPGLIIVTLPSIITLGIIANKAHGKREIVESGTMVIPPSKYEEKLIYDDIYRAVSGDVHKESVSPDIMESGMVPLYEYPDAPRGAWRIGIFECFSDIPSCLTHCFCPCVVVGRIGKAARLFKGVLWITIMVYILDMLITLVGVGGLLWVVFSTYIVYKARERISNIYDIPINPLDNCCLSFWCNPCAAAQVASHIFGKDRVYEQSGNSYTARITESPDTPEIMRR